MSCKVLQPGRPVGVETEGKVTGPSAIICFLVLRFSNLAYS